jgi:hypothetical protein
MVRSIRVASWFFFSDQKFPTLVLILLPMGIFYGHLVILSSFGIFSPLWYSVPRKIWQPCEATRKSHTDRVSTPYVMSKNSFYLKTVFVHPPRLYLPTKLVRVVPFRQFMLTHDRDQGRFTGSDNDLAGSDVIASVAGHRDTPESVERVLCYSDILAQNFFIYIGVKKHKN